MDNKSFKKIFQTNPLKKAEMLEMLRNKMSLSSIARHFGVDHSTILYHKQKHGINYKAMAGRPRNPTPKVLPVYPKDKKSSPLEDEILGDKINVGKLTYAEYVRAEQERKEKLSTPPKKGR